MTILCVHNNSIAIFQVPLFVHCYLIQNGFFAPTQVTAGQYCTLKEKKEVSKWPHCLRIISQVYLKKEKELNKWMAAFVQFRDLRDSGWDLTEFGWKMKTRLDLRWVGVLEMGLPTLLALSASQVSKFFLIYFRGETIKSRALWQIYNYRKWWCVGIFVKWRHRPYRVAFLPKQLSWASR